MKDLLDTVINWHALMLVLVVYGFAPGFLLRLFVLMYPHDDPRRRELVAEFYTVPRWNRPFWVLEQLETALFEGLSLRVAGLTAFLRRQRPRGGTVAEDVTVIEGAISFPSRMRLNFAESVEGGSAVLDELSDWFDPADHPEMPLLVLLTMTSKQTGQTAHAAKSASGGFLALRKLMTADHTSLGDPIPIIRDAVVALEALGRNLDD